MRPQLIVLLRLREPGLGFHPGLSHVPPTQWVVTLWWLLRDRTGFKGHFPNSHVGHLSLEKLSAQGVGGLTQEASNAPGGGFDGFGGVSLSHNGFSGRVHESSSTKSFPALFPSSHSSWIQGQWSWRAAVRTRPQTHSPGCSQGAHIPVKHPAPLLVLQTHPTLQQQEEEEAVPRLINDSRLVRSPCAGSRGLFCAVAQAKPSVFRLFGIRRAPCARPHRNAVAQPGTPVWKLNSQSCLH